MLLLYDFKLFLRTRALLLYRYFFRFKVLVGLVLLFNMETTYLSASEGTSVADNTALLILQELKMLRKDLNLGISKLHDEIKLLRPMFKPPRILDVFSRKNGVCNSDNVLNFNDDPPHIDKEQVEFEIEHNDCNLPLNKTELELPERIKTEIVPQSSFSSSSKIDKICEKMLRKQHPAPNFTTCFAKPGDNFDQQQSSSSEMQSTGFGTTQMEKFNTMNGTECTSNESSQNPTMKVLSTFSLRRSDEKDEITHHELTQMCKLCGKWFTSYHKLKKHHIQAHNRINKHVCKYCGRFVLQCS